jgi:hypothetical protein
MPRVLVVASDACIAHSCAEILRAHGLLALAGPGAGGVAARTAEASPDVILLWYEEEIDLEALRGSYPCVPLVICAYGQRLAPPERATVVPLPFHAARLAEALRQAARGPASDLATVA